MLKPLFFSRISQWLIALAIIFLAVVAQAQGLSDALGSSIWGDDSEQVLLTIHDDRFEIYRTAIEGMTDPLRIDALRREAQAEYNGIAASLEIFSEARSGYEVSVLGSEIAINQSLSMITRRLENNNEYYVFRDDILVKLVVTYDMEALGWISFDEFYESLESFLGYPDDSDWVDDEYGIPHLERVSWDDGITRLRIENKSRVFNSYILVYSDSATEDFYYDSDPVARVSNTRRTSVLDLLGDDEEEYNDNSDVVDAIIGGRPEIELSLPEHDEEETPFWAEENNATSAMDDDEELEETDRRERRRERRERQEEEPEEESLEIR